MLKKLKDRGYEENEFQVTIEFNGIGTDECGLLTLVERKTMYSVDVIVENRRKVTGALKEAEIRLEEMLKKLDIQREIEEALIDIVE